MTSQSLIQTLSSNTCEYYITSSNHLLAGAAEKAKEMKTLLLCRTATKRHFPVLLASRGSALSKSSLKPHRSPQMTTLLTLNSPVMTLSMPMVALADHLAPPIVCHSLIRFCRSFRVDSQTATAKKATPPRIPFQIILRSNWTLKRALSEGELQQWSCIS